MKAVITGASSGIGKSFVLYLSSLGYDIYAVARSESALKELGSEVATAYTPIALDLSINENCYQLYEILKNEKIDIFINNAGFGVYGSFDSISLERELDMINLNVSAVHILTKLFASKFLPDGSGLIINVASTAGFMMGPLLSSYYATKAYVLRLSEAVDEEVGRKNPNVRVCVLCPGPVCTGFDKAAGVSASMKGHTPDFVAKYAITKALRGKRIIIPGLSNKLLVVFSRFLPSTLLSRINYMIQSTKGR